MDQNTHAQIQLLVGKVGGAVISAAGILGREPILLGVGLLAVVYGYWPRRKDGSWRFFLRAPEQLPVLPVVVVTHKGCGDWCRPRDPVSTLSVKGLEVANPTDTPVEIRITGHWHHMGEDIVAAEATGHGEFRVEAHSSGPKPPVGELRFEVPGKERVRLGINFSWVQGSHRYIRVADHLTGETLATIEVADASQWWQTRNRVLPVLRKAGLVGS